MNKIKAVIKNDLWLVLLDAIVIYCSYYVALAGRIRIAGGVAADWHEPLSHLQAFTFIYIVLCVAVFSAFRLYSGVWKYAGVNDFLKLLAANILTFVIQFFGTTVFVRKMPFTYYVVGAALQLGLTTGIRFAWRILQLLQKRKAISQRDAALVVGSGSIGQNVITMLVNGNTYRPACIVDREDANCGRKMDGRPVYRMDELETAIARHNIRCVCLADSMMDPDTRASVTALCREKNIELRDYTRLYSTVAKKTASGGGKKKTSMNILISAAGRRVELIQSLRTAALSLGKNLKVYGADMDPTAPALAFCDGARITVPMRDPKYIDEMLAICKEDKIDLVIPTIDTDLLVLAENKERFKEIGTRVMVADPDKVAICRDKNLTYQFFCDCGLHAPQTVNKRELYHGPYPAFIKPKNGSSSIQAYKVKDEEDLDFYVTTVKDYIIQPFIEGTEYSVDIFCDWDGEPLSIVPRVRQEVRTGEVIKTKIFMDPTIISEIKTLCKSLKPCGPATVQLIRQKETGIDYYIEINPRYGGGAPLSMKAGANSAELILKMLSGEKVEYREDFADGAVYTRFYESVCTYEELGKIQGVVFDLDDTLYPMKEYIRSGFRAVAAYLGDASLAESLWTQYQNENPDELDIDEFLQQHVWEGEQEKVLDIYHNHEPNIHLYPGVRETLEELRIRGLVLGLITDGCPGEQRRKLKALGLEGLLDDVIVSEELGGEQFRKPCDIPFRMIQTKWRLPVNEIVYVGSGPKLDFKAPQLIGLKTIWYNNPDRNIDEEDIVEGVSEITGIPELAKLI